MSMKKIRQAVTKVNCALELDRRIIGVKFLLQKRNLNKQMQNQLIQRCIIVEWLNLQWQEIA